MTQKTPEGLAGIYPALTYRDPHAALAWLERAFGFKKLLEVSTSDGGIAHAEMSFGGGIILLGTAQEERGWRSPRDLPAVSQTVYVYVADPDAHYAHAKAAGAEIVYEPKTTDYGAREYCTRDSEGHVWSFGTYRPDDGNG